MSLQQPRKGRPVDEEAHFRLDEHERKLEAVKPETLAAMLQGAVEALHARHQVDLERLIAAQREDIDTDRKVIEKLEALADRITELVEALSRPKTRTATVQLPSGPATINVREG
ncbi:MAG TPA: hypothetical protein VMU47_06645 [Caldimonas sp.]|nr:hypothetical protein [Caldimonas sp.]